MMDGPHLFQTGDLVRNPDGHHALVVEAGNIGAILLLPVAFAPDERIEIEQGAPEWTVVQTAPGFCGCCRKYVGEENLVDGDCAQCWSWAGVQQDAARRGVALAKYFDSPFYQVLSWFRARGLLGEWLDMLEAGALSVPPRTYTYPPGTER